MQILSGDIGGTNCRLACYAVDTSSKGATWDRLVQATYPSADFADLTEILRSFISDHGLRPDAAGLGLAGPVHGRTCRTTNLPWVVDADQLQRLLSIPNVVLLNDLEATAWGIGALAAKDLCTLQPGDENACGNRAVIAAGTGLGQAVLCWDGEAHRPFATEGGHCDFAPVNELEMELLGFLQREFGHVSWERLVSGPGLENIYRFLQQHHGVDAVPDQAGQIARCAAEGDGLCIQAMEIFFRLFAAEAGNLALKAAARGGVYIAGGIAPKNLAWLQRPEFLKNFLDKGRMSGQVEAMPLHVILDDQIALLGPVRYILGKQK